MNIILKNASLILSGNTILDNISLEIEEGEICCILGKNGAGKTSLFKCILGGLPLSSGEVIIGNSILNAKNRENLLHKIGALLNKTISYDHLSVWQNISIIAQLYSINDPIIYLKTLETVGLINEKDKLVKHLSTGMKQRLGLAIAYVHSPQFLLLDEPTNTLDPQAIIEFREIIKLLNSKNNVSIVYSTHNIEEAQKLSSRIIILKDGKIVFDSKKDAVSLYEIAIAPQNNFKEGTKKIDFYTNKNDIFILYNFMDRDNIHSSFKINSIRSATIEDIYLAKHCAIL
ncbi:ABC transporter ATP-binding protein [Runella sp.]|uniref:ABC transporter ATP-binding protein n=1 Tax=Runella sp. TaxID=1960881 RepID=UPI003D0A79B2